MMILAYHSISPSRTDNLAVSVANFRRQIEWLARRNYHGVSLRDYMSGRNLPKRPIVLTFDDGYADNYTHAWPILQAYGFRATIFLVADYVNTDNIYPWDADHDPRACRVLNREEVMRLQDAGIEFGSHTCTHPRLANIDRDRAWYEIQHSKQKLSDFLGRSVDTFCYPHGSLTDETIALVKEAGYQAAVVTPPRAGIPRTAYTLRRMGVYYGNTMRNFHLKLLPGMGRLREWMLR